MTLAQLTGAPLLMGFLYRAADYRHQVLEISAPVPVDGDIETAFERCAAEVSAAMRRNPANWAFWPDTGNLIAMGLIPRGGTGHQPRERSPSHPGDSYTMDRQITPQLGAGLFLLHAPSVYDFRERDDMLFAYRLVLDQAAVGRLRLRREDRERRAVPAAGSSLAR